MSEISGLESGEEKKDAKSQKSDASVDSLPPEPRNHEEINTEMAEVSAPGMRVPPVLTFDGNMKEKWEKWQQKYEFYMRAAGLSKVDNERKVAILLNTIGEEGLEKFNTFNLSAEEKKDPDKVLKAFSDYCSPKANQTIDRHLFFTRVQQSGESFISYLTELKVLSTPCDFGELKDSLIRDRIVCGIRDGELKNRLLRESDLTLDRCIDICKAAELADVQMKTQSTL